MSNVKVRIKKNERGVTTFLLAKKGESFNGGNTATLEPVGNNKWRLTTREENSDASSYLETAGKSLRDVINEIGI